MNNERPGACKTSTGFETEKRKQELILSQTVKKIVPADSGATGLLLLLNNPAGLALYNRNANKIERLWQSPRPARKYNSVLTDAKGNVWLLHESGIDRFSPQRGIWPVYTATAHTLFLGRFDAEGVLGIGTGDGLLRYNVPTSQAGYFSASFNGTTAENTSFLFSLFAKDVCPDNRGRIWIAAPKYGLFCSDKTAQRFTPYRQPSLAATVAAIRNSITPSAWTKG